MGNIYEKLSSCGLKGPLALYERIKGGLYGLLPRMPICPNKIIFDNFRGKGFGDDPKYIALELLRRTPSLKIYWILQDPTEPLPKGIRPLKPYSFLTTYHYCTAKVWVDNVKDYIKPPKRPGQYYIQTWHSTLGFKKNEADAITLDERYVEMARQDAAQTDLMYSNNDFRCEKYRSTYWYTGEVIKCGVPRMEPLYHDTAQAKARVCQTFGLTDRQIVLYAPTFRDSVRYSDYAMDLQRCLDALNKRFPGKPFVMLIRLHPNEFRRFGTFPQMDSCVYDACTYPDMQELLAAVDVLITDYSGCMFDFAFVEKPAFLFTKDYAHYTQKERGLYFTLEQLPFSRADTDEALETSILNYSEPEYKQRCEDFRRQIGYHDDGSGSKQLADIILKKMGRRVP